MKQKTPIQEHFANIRVQIAFLERTNKGDENDWKIDYLYSLLEKEESMLKKEKEMIIKTYNHAVLHGYLVQLGEDKPIDAEQYYNKTFNTKEK